MKAQAERYKALVADNAVSKQDYDNAVSSRGQAEADVASGKAAVDTAQINLGYTDGRRRRSAAARHIAGHGGRLRAGKRRDADDARSSRSIRCTST